MKLYDLRQASPVHFHKSEARGAPQRHSIHHGARRRPPSPSFRWVKLDVPPSHRVPPRNSSSPRVINR
jgi:hypothetical protein